MSGIWAAYNKALAANPLLVKAMTSFTGFTVGDILAQKFISPDESYDFARTLRLGVCVPTRVFFQSCRSDGRWRELTGVFRLTGMRSLTYAFSDCRLTFLVPTKMFAVVSPFCTILLFTSAR